MNRRTVCDNFVINEEVRHPRVTAGIHPTLPPQSLSKPFVPTHQVATRRTDPFHTKKMASAVTSSARAAITSRPIAPKRGAKPLRAVRSVRAPPAPSNLFGTHPQGLGQILLHLLPSLPPTASAALTDASPTRSTL